MKLSDLWSIISCYVGNTSFAGADENYCTALFRIADNIVGFTTDEVLLENKLIMAIATRLKAESFLKQKIIENGEICADSTRNQTRDWFQKANNYLSNTERTVIDEVNLITPESIHLNAFMYEPLIDISDWTLKELYQRVKALY